MTKKTKFVIVQHKYETWLLKNTNIIWQQSYFLKEWKR